MAQADDVSISTQTEHTTELARVLKQYTVAHDKWQALVTEADRLMNEATVRESQAKDLAAEVADLKAKLSQALGGITLVKAGAAK